MPRLKNRRWVHYETGPLGVSMCGKKDFKLRMTKTKNRVTCRRCIREMKTVFWYCSEHGFIEDANVTFDEKCEMCGRTAAA